MLNIKNSPEIQSLKPTPDELFEAECVAARYIRATRFKKAVTQIVYDAMAREGANIERLWGEVFQLLHSIDEANEAANGPDFETVSDLAIAIDGSGLAHNDIVTIATRVFGNLLYKKSKEDDAAPQPTATESRTPLTVLKGGKP